MTIALMGAAQTGTEDTSAFNARVTTLEQRVGDETLTTTAQDCTGAINELDEAVGTNATAIGALETMVGDTALPTTAQTLSGAIAELDTDVSHCAVRSYHTNDALEAAEGEVTWEISTPRWQYCVVSVYVTSTGVEVTPTSITHTTNKITLELAADADVASGYFTATIVG